MAKRRENVTRTNDNSRDPEPVPWCDCCMVTTASEGRSRVDMPGSAAVWRVSSGTLLQQNHQVAGKLCDFIIKGVRLSDNIERRVLAELKSKSARASTVQEQLQGGADLLQGDAVVLSPVLVHQGIDGMELRVLRGKVVTHRGRRYRIAVKKSPFDASSLFD